jgi:transposase
VLGASSYTFACATRGRPRSDWLTGMGRALNFIGGVPALIVPDNPRALVCRGQTATNRRSIGPPPSSPPLRHGDPAGPTPKAAGQGQGRIGVQVVERWILARLRHRRFFSVAELDAAVAELLPALNTRPFKKLPGCRRDAFALLDAPYLRPLPASCLRHRRVEEGPRQHRLPRRIRRQLLQRAACAGAPGSRTAHHALTIEVLAKGKRVASHPRSPARGTTPRLAEHMPAAHRAHADWSPGKLLTWAASVGPSTAELVKRLLIEKRIRNKAIAPAWA